MKPNSEPMETKHTKKPNRKTRSNPFTQQSPAFGVMEKEWSKLDAREVLKKIRNKAWAKP